MSILDYSIPKLVNLLCNDRIEPDDYIDALEEHFNEREPDVLAFVPEPNRWARVRAEVKALKERYPDSARRPVLFCIPIGVKDIFHVAGMETHIAIS